MHGIDLLTQPFLSFPIYLPFAGPWHIVVLALEANRPTAVLSALRTSHSWLPLGRQKRPFCFGSFLFQVTLCWLSLEVSLTSETPSKTTFEINTWWSFQKPVSFWLTLADSLRACLVTFLEFSREAFVVSGIYILICFHFPKLEPSS